MLSLSKAEYENWLHEHGLVEKDKHGPKVLRCSNGDYIKLFRIKHLISLSRLINPADRFCRNAERLKQLGFNTVTPIQCWHIPQQQRWAVRYTPVAGESLRKLIEKNRGADCPLPEKVIADTGALIAALHDKGVYFRSLHPGNIILQSDGQLGLIDILDCRFSWFGLSLSENQRERNFAHWCRYADGRSIETPLRKAYQEARTGTKTENK